MSDDQITDQITDLARLLPAVRAPDLPADRLQILKEHLMVEYRLAAGNRRPIPQRRRTRRPLLAALGVGAVLAAAAATSVAVVLLLQSLPTDPRTLLSQICTFDQKNGEGQALGSDGEAFVTIGDLIRETIVPPSTAAALYRAAALIPGVTLIGRVTNVEGQPGIAIAWTNSQDRYEWIFDPATLQYVGERDDDMSTGKPRRDWERRRPAARLRRQGRAAPLEGAVCSARVSRPGGRAGPSRPGEEGPGSIRQGGR